MQAHGWTLLFHDCLLDQLNRLRNAAERATRHDARAGETNANVKLYAALSKLILDVVPIEPGRDEYRQGNTMGQAYRHWRRAKIGRRFRLFFRYDTRSKVIVYVWVNDEHTLRSAGSKSDPYHVFQQMLARGNPPDNWAALLAQCKPDWR